jgi:hypothetical protein
MDSQECLWLYGETGFPMAYGSGVCVVQDEAQCTVGMGSPILMLVKFKRKSAGKKEQDEKKR